MDSESIRTDITIAGAAAGLTIVLSLLFEYGLGLDVGFIPQVTPLGVYFLYTVTHRQLPDGVDTVGMWVGLAILVAVATVVVVTIL